MDRIFEGLVGELGNVLSDRKEKVMLMNRFLKLKVCEMNQSLSEEVIEGVNYFIRKTELDVPKSYDLLVDCVQSVKHD